MCRQTLYANLGKKWTPYENTRSGEKSGVTEYVGGSDHVTSEVKHALKNITNVFRLPFQPIISRQVQAFDHIATSPFTELGLGLGVGENFHASAHTGVFKGFHCV